jgi:hypothetical protein
MSCSLSIVAECVVNTRRAHTWVVRLLMLVPLFFMLSCGRGGKPPPHPPPDPKLDVIVVGTQVQLNGQALDVSTVTPERIIKALGEAPLVDGEWLHFLKLGVSFKLEQRGLTTLHVVFTPYGFAKERGTAGFQGRLLVNGAWIHRDAHIYHVEREMGRPCTDGNQGVGDFAKSPFRDSWHCDVAGQPLVYWMKRYPDAEHPVFAFDVEFHERPFPPQVQSPDVSWSDVVQLPFDVLWMVFDTLRTMLEMLGLLEQTRVGFRESQ